MGQSVRFFGQQDRGLSCIALLNTDKGVTVEITALQRKKLLRNFLYDIEVEFEPTHQKG